MSLHPTYGGGASRPFDRPPVFRNAVQAATLTGAVVLTRLHPRFLALDPGGASRNVTLPAGDDGDLFIFRNTADAAEDLVIKDPDGNTLATAPQAGTVIVACDPDGTWSTLLAGASTSISGTADSIAEVTPGAGVTIDGLLLKDSGIDASALLTGVGYLKLGDNLASAWVVKEGANAYLVFDTRNDRERVQFGKLLADPAIVTIDMADAQVALVYGTAGAGEKKVTSRVLFVDANSSGTEKLLLPPEATSAGIALDIFNTGGESIVVRDDGDGTTVVTIPTAKAARVACDGTTWLGLLGA